MSSNSPTVLFEDNHLLVVNKPGGFLTQPNDTDQASVEAWGKSWLKEKYQKPGNVFLGAVHRIDKPVSGVVLLAKTSKALSRLNAAMRNKQTHKLYIALVQGTLRKKEGILEHYLIHDEYRASVVDKKNPAAKLARLRYRVLSETSGYSVLEIILETGRYHQIRAQLADVGAPILGDFKYGSTMPLLGVVSESSIALHHHRLQIPHPISGEMCVFEAPVPSGWPEGLRKI